MKQRRSTAEVVTRALAADPGHPSTRRQTRGLTEGAVLAALTAVVAAVGLVIPFVGILLAPIPVMLLVMRWGMRTALLAAVVAGLILLQFFGPLVALSVTVIFAPIGLAMGWGVRRGIGAQLTVLTGSAAFLLSSLGTFAITIFVLHQDILGQLIRTQVQAWESAQVWAQHMGAPQSRIDEMRNAVALMPQFLRTTFPVLVALGALVWAYLCYVLARSVLRRIGHDIPAVPPILSWRLPTALASSLLWASAGLSITSTVVPRLGGAGLNAVLINLFVFAFQGALVGITWMNARSIPRFAQIIAGMLAFTSGLLPLLALAILGILDTWYDFRRLGESPRPTGAPTEPDPHPAPGATPPAVRSKRRQRVKAGESQ
jgi:uncharacterized protein YybS (DUF2232 family)